MKIKKAMISEDMAKKLPVFRSAQKLASAGLCIKETRTLKGGGHYHVYSARSSNIQGTNRAENK